MAAPGPQRDRHPSLLSAPTRLRLTAHNVARLLAMLFLAYGIVSVACLAKLMPPFQNGDEENHFLRADQISRGGAIAVAYDALSGGGEADIGIERAANLGANVIFHRERKFSRLLLEQQNAVPWTTATLLGFANTALYPPSFYLPAALATRLGRSVGLSIVQTLQVARLASGLACVLLGALAVACAEREAAWIFTVLFLPMTVALMAAVSHDGLSIACAALAASLTASSIARGHTGRARLFFCSLLLLLVATDKPPLAPLALCLMALPALSLAWRVSAVAVVCGGSLTWSALVAPFTRAFTRDTIAPSGQLRFLLHTPWDAISIAYHTLTLHGREYLDEFIGVLGWLDVDLPTAFHALAWLALGAGFLLCLPGRSPRWDRGATFCAVGTLAACAAIFGAQYMTWTPVGQGWVEGVQGRYFLPVALFIPCLLPRPSAPDAGAGWPMAPALGLLALFPPVSIVVVLNAIVWRYYL